VWQTGSGEWAADDWEQLLAAWGLFFVRLGVGRAFAGKSTVGQPGRGVFMQVVHKVNNGVLA
jgi:hypothetical protein